MQSLDRFSEAKLASLAGRGLRRTIAETDRHEGARADRDGRRLISFSCNDYLGLSQHPAVREAAARAARDYGAGAGASRLITGSHPLYAELEDRLARLKGTAAACVFGSGYLANIGIIPTLAGPKDLILMDALSHACIHAGAKLADTETHLFRHNDADHLERLLEARRGACEHCLIVTEGVFSMDGDRAPLAALQDVAERYDSWLLVDDAHGLGVIGDGRGSAAAAGIDTIPLQMGTLSKAVGSYGGFLAASAPVIALMKNRARSVVYTTGLPPAAVAASVAALDIIATEPDRVAAPLSHARRFTAALDLPQAESAVVPLIVGTPERALAASKALEEAGFLVAAIRPPTVPDGTARLRFAFSAAHSTDDVDALVAAMRKTGLSDVPAMLTA